MRAFTLYNLINIKNIAPVYVFEVNKDLSSLFNIVLIKGD